MATLLILTLILNWFLFAEKVEVVGQNLGLFALTLVTPMLFTRACNVLTPGLDTKDTREHYLTVLKPFFLLLTAHVVFNIAIQAIIQNDGFNLQRLIGVPLLLAAALYHKLWVRIIVMAALFGILLYMFTVQQLGYQG